MVKWKSVISVVFLALFLVLALGSSSDTPAKVDNGHEQNGDDPKQPEIFAVGDRVQMGDFYITVRSAKFSKGTSFIKPDTGNKWIVIDIELENRSDKSVAVSSLLMFNLYDEENYAGKLAINTDEKGNLNGELGAGRKMAGEITFEVPANHTTFELIFEPNVFGTGQAIFKLENVK